MDDAALQEEPKLERRTAYIAMLGNLCVLAGLVGTITGLIQSFWDAAGADPAHKAERLSRGISQAMTCTAFGLTVGMVGLGCYAYLAGVVQDVQKDIDAARTRVGESLAALHPMEA